MTPSEFIKKWSKVTAKESAADREHFNDLCRLLGVPTPLEADPSGNTHYCFQKHVKKATGKKGFADVWKQGCFGWEYKDKNASDLRDAYIQLLGYKDDLENPPLLIVSNLDRIEIHTQFTGVPKTIYTYTLQDLESKAKRDELRQAWVDPNAFNPRQDRESLTQATFKTLEKLADHLKFNLGYSADKTAHFLVKIVFTLFAEHEGLLGDKTFGRLLKAALEYPSDFQFMCEELFAKMNTGGLSIVGRIPYFNGGIFTDSEAPSLDRYGIQQLLDAYTQDWKNIEPSIFGSLFEGAIDPERRSQLGAHYTPASDILDVIEPVIIEPLRAEWNAIREEIEPAIQAFYAQYHSDEGLFAAHNLKEQQAEIKSKITGFLDRLASIKVLDPACGSGNFLYLTQQRLIEFESEVRAKLEPVNDGLPVPTRIHPSQFHGIDLNEYSPEITNMVLWIGFIQARKALNEPVVVGDVGVPGREPILKDLTTIQHHDALLDEGEPDGKYKWPKVDFIVGNPPFLGNHKMREKLSDAYVEKLRATYEDLVGGRSDLVCFWFAQAYEMVKAGTTQRVGLIATNSIRQTSNRNVLARIKESGDIFLAWPDRPWIQDGASVQVSIVCFDNGTESNKRILTFKGSTGEKVLTQVDSISVDLRPDIDLATARVIPEQVNLVYKGMEPAGPFDIPKELAASWLDLPNPSGVKNQDVLKPYLKGDDITGKPVGHWIIDFNDMTLEEARKYKAPFAYAQEHVKPLRDTNRNAGRREMWWQFGRPRPALRAAVASFQRYLVTPRVAKYRTYSWASIDSIPSNALAVIAKEDNFTYGVLNSKIHAVWAHHVGSSLEDRPQFTNLCIESFPFPQCNDAMRAQIEEAARYLDQMRTFIKDKSGLSLTGIYNALEDFVAKGATQEKHQGLSQLLQAENELDGLVAQAYGWSWPLSEFEILTNLLELNLALTDPVGPTV